MLGTFEEGFQVKRIAVVFLVLLLFAPLFTFSAIQCWSALPAGLLLQLYSPPAKSGEIIKTGTWEVDGTEEYADVTIVLNGTLVVKSGGSLTLLNVTLNVSEGNIIVEEGGSLVLNNSTIRIACYYDGEHSVDVWGVLNVTNGSSISSLDRAFLFAIHDGAEVYMANSSVSRCGYTLSIGWQWDPTQGRQNIVIFDLYKGGLVVNSSSVTIVNCTFTECYVGAIVVASGVTIDGTAFQNCKYGVLANKGNVILKGCRVTDCDYGFYLASSQNIVEECIFENMKKEGVKLLGSDNLVSTCVFSNCNYAVTISGDRNRVEGNSVSGAEVGFAVSGRENNIAGNVAEECNCSFYSVHSKGGSYTGNIARGGTHGFLVVESKQDSFIGNTVDGAYYGFLLVEVDEATVTGNEISSCNYGVFIWFSNAKVENNVFTGNNVDVFAFGFQEFLTILLALNQWTNQSAASQTVAEIPLFTMAFIVYLKAGRYAKKYCKALGVTGALLLVAAVISFSYYIAESRSAGLSLSTFLTLYFSQLAPPAMSSLYLTPAAYFGYLLYTPQSLLHFIVPNVAFSVKGFDAYFKYSLLTSALLLLGAFLIGVSGKAFPLRIGRILLHGALLTAFLTSHFLVLSANSPAIRIYSILVLLGTYVPYISYSLITYLAANTTFLGFALLYLVAFIFLTGLSSFALSRNVTGTAKVAFAMTLLLSILTALTVGGIISFAAATSNYYTTGISIFRLNEVEWVSNMADQVIDVVTMVMRLIGIPVEQMGLEWQMMLTLSPLVLGYILLAVGFLCLEKKEVLSAEKAGTKPEKWG